MIVVGGGVIGMTTACVLAEDPARRFDVTLVAERFGITSLSGVPAASFFPFAVSHPNVEAWLREGLTRFVALAADHDSGVVVREGFEFAPQPIAGRPPESFLLPAQRRDVPECASGCDAAFFALPIVEIPRYLPFLARRLESLGVGVRRDRVTSLDECARDAIVVNCTGSLARAFAGDPKLRPSLGQLVRLAPCGIDRFALDERDPARPTYVVPRTRDVVVGSIDVEYDVDRLGYEPPLPSKERTADILARAALLEPKVRDAQVIEVYCGFRPKRDAVRLEIDSERLAKGARVIHAYGHGGGGVTLSWGTAVEVAALAARLLRVPV